MRCYTIPASYITNLISLDDGFLLLGRRIVTSDRGLNIAFPVIHWLDGFGDTEIRPRAVGLSWCGAHVLVSASAVYYKIEDKQMVRFDPSPSDMEQLNNDRVYRTNEHIPGKYVISGTSFNAGVSPLQKVFDRKADPADVIVFDRGVPTFYRFYDIPTSRTAVSRDGAIACAVSEVRDNQVVVVLFDI